MKKKKDFKIELDIDYKDDVEIRKVVVLVLALAPQLLDSVSKVL